MNVKNVSFQNQGWKALKVENEMIDDNYHFIIYIKNDMKKIWCQKNGIVHATPIEEAKQKQWKKT